ncbi:MAG: hypothetical protein JL50_05755 [Peptococcaceae bacterium BICA1-7]|nr:MAG: hypothetical protein JL50_05755 [Peptococcaceae bacterium BICA1-7]HBV96115.1 radical SAM protein [Desulfotomaculum sp.]
MGEFSSVKLYKNVIYSLVHENAAQSNILSLNSTCNVWCKFCSHRQNPPEVESFRIPALALDFLEQAITLLDPRKPVVIGESVTRVIEGEPFIHPEIKKILLSIRERMPGTPIRITTNGTLLDMEMVSFLASLGGVTANLSLNSSNTDVRQYIMKDSRAETAVKSALLLREQSVPYHGSIVAMPHLTGWDDLAGTIKYFDQCGAETVRVFVPGDTRLAPPALRIPGNLREHLDLFLEEVRVETSVPVTLEPPQIKNLRASVSGVVAGSPAQKAGLRPGDHIEKVNGSRVKSRVDAFRKVLEGESPALDLTRSGNNYSVKVIKERGESSGLVFDYDVDPCAIREIEAAVRRKRAGKVVLMASELGFGAMRLALEEMWDGGAEVIRPVMVKNHYFGGSIGCAGLLTVGDLLEAVRDNVGKADLCLVPGIAFDRRGRDITGRSYLELEIEKGPEIEVV